MNLKHDAIEMVSSVVHHVIGFKHIITKRISANPTVISVEFDSVDHTMEFVRDHKQMSNMSGMWAAPHQTQEARAKYRALFKIKRAIIETTNCNADMIIVDKPKRKLFRVVDRKLVEICSVSTSNVISWNSTVEQQIRDRAIQLAAE